SIQKVTNDIGAEQQFNTAIAALMELFNTFSAAEPGPKLAKLVLRNMALMLAPFVPHFAEEMWERTGGEPGIFRQAWPAFDPALTVEENIELVIQVNGRIRGRASLPRGCSQEDAEKAALEDEKTAEFTRGKQVIKKIFVPDKLLNIVVK
ncbi:MAG TPA: leucine--tRNA ligase, partial [bacterium]|nr:leucine--tRNA ligase [bacterium]